MTRRCSAGFAALVAFAAFAAARSRHHVAGADATAAKKPWVPADWRALPELVGNVGAGAKVVSKAWGDPAAGVFGLITIAVAAAGDDDIEAVHESFRADSQKRGAVISGWVYAEGRSRHRFELGKLHGAVSAVTVSAEGLLTTSAASCFFTERQAERSNATCDEFLRRFEEGRR